MQDEKQFRCEISRLRTEVTGLGDAKKEIAMFGAIQALEWALDPSVAVAPTWACLSGKIQPLTDILAS